MGGCDSKDEFVSDGIANLTHAEVINPAIVDKI